MDDIKKLSTIPNQTQSNDVKYVSKKDYEVTVLSNYMEKILEKSDNLLLEFLVRVRHWMWIGLPYFGVNETIVI